MNIKPDYKRDFVMSITCFFLALLLFLSMGRINSEALADRIAPEILRFHVLANSNSAVDQRLKLLVRTKLLRLIYADLGENASLDETIHYITGHQEELAAQAENYIRQLGYDYGVEMELADCYFPTKAYGDMVFPCGTYKALRVEIGKGKGHNWWCVLYPPLCFTDTCYGAVPDSSKDYLKNVLEEPDYEQLLLLPPEDGKKEQPKEIRINLRFKSAELLKRVFTKEHPAP